jgi:virginiamycin B lyase
LHRSRSNDVAGGPLGWASDPSKEANVFRNWVPWFLLPALAGCTVVEEAPPVPSRPLAAATREFVAIGEFPVLTRGSMPFGVATGVDGSLWFTERRANKIAKFDPNITGFREYPISIADSAPQSIVVDASGEVWFTANGQGYIGMLDAASGEITGYDLGPRARDPYSIVDAADGSLWFTARRGNVVGRLDRRDGSTTFRDLPAGALPTDLVMGQDGSVYVSESGSRKIARIVPGMLDVREFTLPPGASPRGIALGTDGTLYYTDYARGKLGHLDPAKHQVREWDTPNGARSKPYAIAVAPDGHVWFTESGVEPNTLVRFDPTSTTFDVAVIPSGGGGIRSMALAPLGKIYFASGNADQVGIATPIAGPALVSRR